VAWIAHAGGVCASATAASVLAFLEDFGGGSGTPMVLVMGAGSGGCREVGVGGTAPGGSRFESTWQLTSSCDCAPLSMCRSAVNKRARNRLGNLAHAPPARLGIPRELVDLAPRNSAPLGMGVEAQRRPDSACSACSALGWGSLGSAGPADYRHCGISGDRRLGVDLWNIWLQSPRTIVPRPWRPTG
jgi:hypothetical protein